MFDAQQIAGAMAGLKAASEIAKAVMGAKIDYEVKEKVLAIQQSLIEAQQSMLTMQQALSDANQRTRNAEDALMAANDWTQEKERYKQFAPYTGTLVYAVKNSEAHGDLPHYICANCYQRGNKAILSFEKLQDGFFALKCTACKYKAPTGYRSAGQFEYPPE